MSSVDAARASGSVDAHHAAVSFTDEAEDGGGVAQPSDESEFCAWVTVRLISGAERTFYF